MAGVDVTIVKRRASQDLTGSRAGGLHSRTIEVLGQRGIADRFLSQGQVAAQGLSRMGDRGASQTLRHSLENQVASFSHITLNISDFPTQHNYGLGLWQNRIERILAGWGGELAVPSHCGREVTRFVYNDTGIDVELSGGPSPRADYLVGFQEDPF